MRRRDDELPAAIHNWGWCYHHTGIPTEEHKEGEKYLPELKMHVCGFSESPYGIEWMRFEPDSPISRLVRNVPHVAFEIDDKERALQGKQIMTPPCSPSPGVRVAMIVDNGCPIELLQFECDQNRNGMLGDTMHA